MNPSEENLWTEEELDDMFGPDPGRDVGYEAWR